ncbi:MAG: hypothetical protein V4604_05295 [Bacteroidota bacterium]
MKTLISAFILFLSFSAFAEKNALVEWQVTYEADSTMRATDTKVTVHCYFTGNYDGKPRPVIYSVNGAPNETARLSGANEFMINRGVGKYTLQVYANSSFPEIMTDSIEVKAGIGTHIYLYFRGERTHYELEKPVIYLYPEVPTAISVDLKTIGKLNFTYPLLSEGWNVTAQPDGTLTCNGKNYPYLFWEADQQIQNPFELETFEGFVIAGKDALTFLEEKLTQIGFNDRERTDFITYWGPQLCANEFNNVTFQFNDACDAYATLDIVPKPENINRVYMIWSKTDAAALDKTITPQELPVLDRSGFDVLEWGGVEVDDVEM